MPTSYGIYNRNKGKIREGRIKTKLHRYPYRYRLAKAFKGINVEKGLEKSLDGYEIGLKILLATSALEEVREAAKDLQIDQAFGSQGRAFVSEGANKALRRNIRLHKFVIAQARDSIQRNELQRYFDARDNDIIGLAFALRHAFGHGDFTPGGAGITKHSKIYFLEVAESALNYSDQLFDKCVRLLLTYR